MIPVILGANPWISNDRTRDLTALAQYNSSNDYQVPFVLTLEPADFLPSFGVLNTAQSIISSITCSIDVVATGTAFGYLSIFGRVDL